MRGLFAFFALAAVVTAHAQVVLGQVDTFSDGSTLFWTGGNGPTNISSGGPAGAGDRYLQVVGLGGVGIGSVPATHNSLQWSGNFPAAGVKAVQLDIKNFSATPLNMRLVFFGPLGSRWTSHPGFSLPGNSTWLKATFVLRPTEFVRVAGTESFSDVFGANTQMMIRNDFDPPSAGGEGAAATFGMDNVTALASIPAAAESFVVTGGILLGGTLSDLHTSNNGYVVVLNDEVDTTGIVQVSSTAPQPIPNPVAPPSAVKINLESAATRTDLSEFLQAWNFVTSSWTSVNIRVPSLSDSSASGSITANTENYTGNLEEIRARVMWIPQLDIESADGWTERVDFLNWEFIP